MHRSRESHKSRLGGLVLDSRVADLAESAAFWSRALGYDREPPKPEAGNEEAYVDLFGPDTEVKMLLQKVAHESRVHLDIETDDIPAEVARLEALGARRIAAIQDWIVLEAPTGHRFCVVPAQRPDFRDHARAWGDRCEDPPKR